MFRFAGILLAAGCLVFVVGIALYAALPSDLGTPSAETSYSDARREATTLSSQMERGGRVIARSYEPTLPAVVGYLAALVCGLALLGGLGYVLGLFVNAALTHFIRELRARHSRQTLLLEQVKA
jgi:hypothetical protein